MAHCDDALRAIGRAILCYQQNNQGCNPPGFKALLSDADDLTAWQFICPVGPEPIGQSSYVYRGADLDGDAPAEMILAYDRSAVHKGRRNVLFADGRVTRPTESDFEKAIVRDNQLRGEFDLAQKDPHEIGSSEQTL